MIVLVLLQQGKGADVGAAFGGGSNTLFGASGANNLMVKITTGTAILFMVTSIFLVRGYSSLLESGTVSKGIEVQDPGIGDDAPSAAPVEANVDTTSKSGESLPTEAK